MPPPPPSPPFLHDNESAGTRSVKIDAISAVTLATHDMARALRFYRALGFPLRYGGDDAAFSSLSAGNACLNLILEPARA